MDLFLTSQFLSAPQIVHAVYESEAFTIQLADTSGMDKSILEEREEGGFLHRRTHVVRREPLPRFVAKVLGMKKLTYVQVDRIDLGTCSSSWSVEIPSMGQRVSVSGSTVFTPSATGCQRVLRGAVTVKVPVVGRKIEKAVASDFERSAARAVEIARGLLP